MGDDLNRRIATIEARNKRVEADKAWETSFVRRASITLVTYLIAGLFLMSIEISNPWINALVPTGGYVLSTLTLPLIRDWWIKRRGL